MVKNKNKEGNELCELLFFLSLGVYRHFKPKEGDRNAYIKQHYEKGANDD